MGARAIITFNDTDVVHDVTEDIGIYLHWNGNRHWVEAFIRMAKEYGFRYDDYGIARLCQMIGNTIGTTLSMGVGRASRMDDSDNGTYFVAADWTIWESMNTPPLDDEKQVEWYMTEIRAKNDQFFKDTGYPYK